MKRFKACGILCFREAPRRQFLLMRHPTRWDLPKGHIEDGESELECALRETQEETDFTPQQIRLDPDFLWQTSYEARYAWLDGEIVHKTVVIFLGWVDSDAVITVTEHSDYQWVDWQPPHNIQPETIDPLLAAIADHFAQA